MKIPPAGAVIYLALCLICAVCLGCAGPASGQGSTTVRLDNFLAAKITQSTIELTVIDQDPNLIWCLIKLDPGYTGMDGLVERFLLAADSSAVAHGTLNTGGQAELGEFRPGTYWVITHCLIPAGRERLLWSLPVVVDSAATGKRELVFHRSNAALILGPGNTPL